MIKYSLHIAILIFFIGFTSCAKKKEIVKPKKLENKNTKFLIKKIESNQHHFDTFFAKFTAKTFFNDDKLNFKGSIRIKSDSLIWISINKLGGIEVVRMVITQDSVKFINKWKKEYYLEALSKMEGLNGIAINYKMFEDLLTGNPYEFNPDAKYKSSNDNYYYILKSKSKSKTRKVSSINDTDTLLTLNYEEKKYGKALKKYSGEDLILKTFYLYPESFLIAKQTANLLAEQKVIDISYANYQLIENNFMFALNQVIRAASYDKSSRFDLKYSNIKLNKELSYPFKISPKYVPVKKK